MIKQIKLVLVSVYFSIAIAGCLALSTALFISLPYDYRVEIHFDDFGEGSLEFVIAVLFVISTPFFLIWLGKILYQEYIKTMGDKN